MLRSVESLEGASSEELSLEGLVWGLVWGSSIESGYQIQWASDRPYLKGWKVLMAVVLTALVLPRSAVESGHIRR